MAQFEKHSNTRFLEQVLEQVKKGELVTYVELSRSIGIDVRTDGRHYLTSAINSLARDGYVFEPEPTVGYYRLTDDQVIETQAAKRMRRVRGQMHRAVQSITGTNVKELSNEQRIRRSTQLALCGAVTQFTRPKTMLQLNRHAEKSGGSIEIGDTLRLMARPVPEPA